jgi:dihydrofolate reductase
VIALVVAKASNGVIGNSNDLPWYLPADLRHFKELTSGHTVVMGRKTFESIYNRLHGPLPNRRNIVISASRLTFPEGFEHAASPEAALELADEEEVCIIGGATIYKAYLDQGVVDIIYMTEVHANIPGDVYFPELGQNDWRETLRENFQQDDKNPYNYSFVTLRRAV